MDSNQIKQTMETTVAARGSLAPEMPAFPIFIKDNFFSDEDESLIWNGLDKIHELDLFLPPEKTGGAFIDDDQLLKKNDGYFLIPEHIPDTKIKCLYDTLYKVFQGTTYEYAATNVWTQSILNTTRTSFLVSYYEDGDYYNPHKDTSMFTVLIWFYKEPKKFSGGNLFLHDLEHEVEVKNNRLIIIPGRALHSVSPVLLSEENQNQRNGRYCLSLFLN